MANTILVVEDDILLNKILCDWLKSAEYEAIGVTTASDTYRVLSERQVDLIFLDIQLGKESGFNILKQLESDKTKYGDIPVVILSNFSEIDKIEYARQSGAVDFIAKSSVDKEHLIHVARLRLGMGVEKWK